MGSTPADDDRDVALAVTSDDSSSDDEDEAAGDADGAGAGPGSVVLSGQASPSARMLTDGQQQLSGEAPRPSAGELIVQDSEGATWQFSDCRHRSSCCPRKHRQFHRFLAQGCRWLLPTL